MSCKFAGFFLTNLKKKETKQFLIYVIGFDPIKILHCLALQNDHQNLSFVKTIDSVDKRWPEILVKWSTPSFVIFILKQSLFRYLCLIVFQEKKSRDNSLYNLKKCQLGIDFGTN